MSIKLSVEIKDSEVFHSKSNPDRPMMDDNGNEIKWDFTFQHGYIPVDGEEYPIKIKIRLSNENAPYPVGFYEASCVFHVKNETPAFRNSSLWTIKPAQRSK